MTFVPLSWPEHVAVLVRLDDGRDVEGWVEAWRRDPDGWHAWVRYSTGFAEVRVGWFPADRVTES